MNKAIFLLTMVSLTSCCVNVVQNTGRESAILEDNDKYDTDVAADLDIDAEVPVALTHPVAF